MYLITLRRSRSALSIKWLLLSVVQGFISSSSSLVFEEMQEEYTSSFNAMTEQYEWVY